MTPQIREELLQAQQVLILQTMLVYRETHKPITPEDVAKLLPDLPNIFEDEFELTFDRLGLEGKHNTFYSGLSCAQFYDLIYKVHESHHDLLNAIYEDYFDSLDADEEFEPEEIPESDTVLSDITNTVSEQSITIVESRF